MEGIKRERGREERGQILRSHILVIFRYPRHFPGSNLVVAQPLALPGQMEYYNVYFTHTTCVNSIVFLNLQKINHFPGMGEICRKDNLARNMAK